MNQRVSPPEPGIYRRSMPRHELRIKRIRELKRKSEAKRKPNDWWILGSYTLYEALLEEDDGLFQEAIEFFQCGSEIEPPSYSCMLDLAWALNHKGMPSLGIEYARKAFEAFPDSRDVASIYALCLMGVGNDKEALDTLHSVKHLPEFTDFDKSLLKNLKEGVSGKKLFRKECFRLIDDRNLLDAQRGRDEVLKIQKHLLKSLWNETEDRTPELIHALAMACYQLNELDEAKQHLSIAQNLESTAEGYCLAALISRREGDSPSEIDNYRKALEKDPAHPLSLINLASKLCDEGSLNEAIIFLEKAIALPFESEYHYIAYDLCANVLAQLDKDPEEELEWRIKSFNHSKRLSNGLNLVLSQVANGRLKDARRTFNAVKGMSDAPGFKTAIPIDSYKKIIQAFLDATRDNTRDPGYWIAIAQEFGEIFGYQSVRYFLKKAWTYRSNKSQVDRLENLTGLGLFFDKSGLHEESLCAWKLISEEYPCEQAALNYPAKLGMMGRHNEALNAFDSLPRSSERYWTIKGNLLLGSGLYLQAVEAYKKAVREDERFLLPYANGIDAARKAGKPDQIQIFLELLHENEWKSYDANWVEADGLSALGYYQEAVDKYREHLGVTAEYFPDWSQIRPKLVEKDDSIFSSEKERVRTLFHTALKANDFDFCSRLITAIGEWPGLWDGDFTVLAAELAWQQGDHEAAKEKLKNMGAQVPPIVSLAINEMRVGNLETAEECARQVCDFGDEAAGFNHFEGNPLSVAESVLALCLLSNGQTDNAKVLADRAYQRDRQCEWAIVAKAQSTAANGQSGRSRAIVEIGLNRVPGSPWLVSTLFSMYLEDSDFENASRVVNENAQLLDSNGFESVLLQLREQLATSELARIKHQLENINVPSEFEWLDPQMKAWIKAALHLESINLEMHHNMAAFNLCKAIERAACNKYAEPFRDCMNDHRSASSDEDLARFVYSDRPIGLGGLARALRYATKRVDSIQEPIYLRFREFLIGDFGEEYLQLIKKRLAGKLSRIAGLRNRIAHQGTINLNEYEELRRFVFSSGEEKSLFSDMLKPQA